MVGAKHTLEFNMKKIFTDQEKAHQFMDELSERDITRMDIALAENKSSWVVTWYDPSYQRIGRTENERGPRLN